MKTIPLTGGAQAIVDDEDFDLLSCRKWHLNEGYPTYSIRKGKKTDHVHMHQVLMGTPPPGMVTDHKNMLKLDNRRANLRFVSKAMNTYNRSNRRSDLPPGVYKFRKGWMIRFTIDRRTLYYGTFDDKEEAKSIASLLRSSLIYHELTKGTTHGLG